VVCPWHSWMFSVKTGESEYPAHERVDVFPVRVEGEDVLVDIERCANDEAEIDGDLSLREM
jgi:nitrite reductase (NADH) small subunit